jgi:hypothetical protein
MHSIFLVHSNITLISSLAVIQQCKVHNPIFIIAEGYQSPLLPKIEFETIKLPSNFTFLLNCPSYGTNNILKLFFLIMKFDSFVASITQNSPFSLFLPHSKNFFYQVFLTHKKCIELNYVDEGLLSYTNNFHKEKLKTKISFIKKTLTLNYFNRTNVFNEVKKSYSNIYRFVKVTNLYQNVEVIKWPDIYFKEIVDFSNSIILILDNPVHVNACTKDEYFVYIKLLAQRFTSKKIYIKSHPREKDIENILMIFTEAGVKFEIIKNEVILEISLVNSSNVHIYGGWSSLLFYASSMHHNVFSFLGSMKKMLPSATSWIEISIPDTFYQSKIKFI